MAGLKKGDYLLEVCNLQLESLIAPLFFFTWKETLWNAALEKWDPVLWMYLRLWETANIKYANRLADQRTRCLTSIT